MVLFFFRLFSFLLKISNQREWRYMRYLVKTTKKETKPNKTKQQKQTTTTTERQFSKVLSYKVLS